MKRTFTPSVKRPLVAALSLLPLAASAQIANADFESWSANGPDSWTTIDSGITVSQSNSLTYSGNASAAIDVLTGAQSDTDFRQSIDVEAGKSYEFSVWVYHTEGNLAARMYVDGYHNYSSEALIGQWQKLSYSYTASTSKTIEVGLRFYDQTGFDGVERVYVDNFSPAVSGGTGNGCSQSSGTFSLTTDNYGSETSWQITDSSNQQVISGSGYASNTTTETPVCLADGDYTLTVSDSYGDGICCSYGSGQYSLSVAGQTLASGGQFGAQDVTAFSVGSAGGGGSDLSGYYSSADGLTGFELKTALYNIIRGHSTQSYSDLWTFYQSYGDDKYYENDGSILDFYSENPTGNDPYNFTAVADQCGSYSGEGDCYNREHAFPRSWFGGAVAPMNTDVHHVFSTDGYVNGRRSSYPYGEVGSASYVSLNGSKLGNAVSGLGYSGTVFEPIDAFKGDVARAYFYMATRYEPSIGGWQYNSSYGDAVLDGSDAQVFESWFLAMLKQWHAQDPVSQAERDRNDAAYSFQGNRNPFVDHPELISEIWGN